MFSSEWFVNSLTLKRNQVVSLNELNVDHSASDYWISIGDGVLRLFVIHEISGEAFTIGFFSKEKIYFPAHQFEGLEVKLEALTSVSIDANFVQDQDNIDVYKHYLSCLSLINWSLALSMIACSKTTEQKIERLIVMLIFHFGTREKIGYRLPFIITHLRISEILGCTRSTVTRIILSLRENHLMDVEGVDRAWLVSKQLMDRHEKFISVFFASI
ncbi:MAG: hypothetical protein ACON4T_07770 [Synechococcus sp.]